MPPPQGYISKQFDPIEDGAKTPMATCKHCKDKRVAKNIVGRKIHHLAACDAYYTYLQELLAESTDLGNKELNQLPQELKDKIEARTGTALLSRPGQLPSAVTPLNRQALKDELDKTVLRAILTGGLPFDAFQANRHPAILHLCQLVLPDYIPPTQTRIAQAMVDQSRQQEAGHTAPIQSRQQEAGHTAPIQPLSSGTNTPRNIDPREGSYHTPAGSKRPFDLV